MKDIIKKGNKFQAKEVFAMCIINQNLYHDIKISYKSKRKIQTIPEKKYIKDLCKRIPQW